MKNLILTLCTVALSFGAIAQTNIISQTAAGSDNKVKMTQKGSTATTITQAGANGSVKTNLVNLSGSNNNRVNIQQTGSRNEITTDQSGTNNAITTTAAGNDNKAFIYQIKSNNNAADNIVTLTQSGSNNTSTFTQNGIRDQITATQSGTYSTATIKQIGVNSVNGSVDNKLVAERKATIRENLKIFYSMFGYQTTNSQLDLDVEESYHLEYGDTDNSSVDKNSSVTLTQTGLGDEANIYQGYTSNTDLGLSSSDNSITATQAGDSKLSKSVLTIYQSGTSNVITFDQSGVENNNATVNQIGTSNSMDLYQNGSNNTSNFTQSGTSNAMGVDQVGTGNLLTINQSGSNNKIKGLDTNLIGKQDGDYNTGTLTQSGSNNTMNYGQVGNNTTLTATQSGSGNVTDFKAGN